MYPETVDGRALSKAVSEIHLAESSCGNVAGNGGLSSAARRTCCREERRAWNLHSGSRSQEISTLQETNSISDHADD